MAGEMTAKVAASVRDGGTVLVYGALVFPSCPTCTSFRLVNMQDVQSGLLLVSQHLHSVPSGTKTSH